MEYVVVVTKGRDIEEDKSYPTKEQADHRLQKVKNGEVIAIPEITLGLNLFRHGKYFQTIIGESKSLYFLRNLENPDRYDDAIRKCAIRNWFIKKYYDDGIEEYNTEFTDYKEINFGDDDGKVENNEDEVINE